MNDRNQIHKLSSNQISDLDSVDFKIRCSFKKEKHVPVFYDIQNI